MREPKMPSVESASDRMTSEPMFKVKKELREAELSCEEALVEWTDNLRVLEEKIPHNDVLVEAKTYSYDVMYGLVASKINAMLEIQEQLAKLQDELKKANEEEET